MQTERDPYEPDREMQRRGRIRYKTREAARAARLATYWRYDHSDTPTPSNHQQRYAARRGEDAQASARAEAS